MHKATIVVRYLLALILLVMGLNKFVGFLPMPEMPEAAGAFMGALAESGYMLQLIGLTEVASGILLIFPATAALGALILAPLSLNILLFHLVLAPAGIPGYIVFLGNVFLIYVYRERYMPIIGKGAPAGTQAGSSASGEHSGTGRSEHSGRGESTKSPQDPQGSGTAT